MSGIILRRGGMELGKARVRSLARARRRDLDRELAEKTRQTAIHVAQALAERTFPSSQAIGLTVRAVRFDVGLVYITAGRAYASLRATHGPQVAGAFYHQYKRGDYAAAMRIIQQAGSAYLEGVRIGTLDPTLHQRARDPKTGRVRGNPAQIVHRAELRAYQRQVVAGIGKTASGWNAAAQALGGSESGTRWKSTAIHGSSGGSASERTEAGKIGFTITNHRPLARKHISPGQRTRILKDGREYLRKLLAG